MALCNTFRLLAVSVALVVLIKNAEGFSFRRTTTLRRAADLYPDETRASEVREARVTNAHNGNVAYDRNRTETIPNVSNKTSGTKRTNEAPATPKKKTFQDAVTTYRPAAKSGDRNVNNKAVKDDAGPKSTNKKTPHLQNKNISNKSTEIISNEKTREKVYEKQAAPLPSWKKYTFINRNKVEESAPSAKDTVVKVDVPEVLYSASSLRDTITSDIPSLEKLKNDLLSNSKSKSVGQKQNASFAKTTSESKGNDNSKWSVESKRAGYLDYSEKNKEIETDNSKSTTASVEKSPSTKQESPTQQTKDSLIKEILLRESVDNNVRKDQEEKQEKLQLATQISITEKNETQTSIEKSKNASLYTVSPNYKPLKKLEVQPPKPFLRDPDDNSWRNESISSLGIVFKPKNSSKAFTEVLKNKTESEWNTLLEKERKNDLPDLRERLEQMAKMRKTKRKKIDSMGNVVYVDYEENVTSNENTNENNSSNENSNPLQGDIIIPLLSFDPQFFLTGSKLPDSTLSDLTKTDPFTTTVATSINKETTKARKPKKNYNIPDYYESSEDEDLDYLDLAKIDIKKFTTQKTTQTPFDTSTWPVTTYRNTNNDAPERKPNLQYFPPLRNKKISIVKYNAPREEIDKYVNPIDQANFVSTRKPTTTYVPVQYPETNAPFNDKYSPYGVDGFDELPVTNKPTTIANDIYLRQPPRIDEDRIDEQRLQERRLGEQRIGEHRIGEQRIDEPRIEVPRIEVPRIEEEPINRFKIVSDEGNQNRGSYVIKSYDDFINEAEKANEFDSQLEYGPYTEATSETVTTDELVKPDHLNEDLDYDTKFRKDVINRFVENFNRNTAKFKSEFPIIFNSSIVHDTHGDGKEVASSRAFLRGLHGHARRQNKKYNLYDVNQVNTTAEPTYELHYFMPQQDDKDARYKL
ncbi:uncharacterized protein LOC121731993 [Aricia agestis]|uniref:uncharacterized protein LOC121731993 n=1 Tax=Aricia agestis TaxID=91739 RepID=UPI001C2045FD|nr:uncharacterized protein LOC121731993 [Aricia agestis]